MAFGTGAKVVGRWLVYAVVSGSCSALRRRDIAAADRCIIAE